MILIDNSCALLYYIMMVLLKFSLQYCNKWYNYLSAIFIAEVHLAFRASLRAFN